MKKNNTQSGQIIPQGERRVIAQNTLTPFAKTSMNIFMMLAMMPAFMGANAHAGITWPIQTSIPDNPWQAVTYGNDLFA